MNNRNGSTYIGKVHQPFLCFDISRGLGDRMRLRLITERDREFGDYRYTELLSG